ncbi:MAG: thiamine pyrophosphate-binding protein [Promethearchaeota archaeon]
MKVTEIIADMLKQNGIDHIFALPGGVTPFLFEEFYKRPDDFTAIITRHEGTAAVMADMYGRMTGKPGVLIGQGLWIATNGGYGIAESYFAGVPMLVLTEYSDWNGVNHHAPYQSGTGEYGTVDIRNIFKSFSKYTAEANSPGELLYAIQLAIKHATSGRPGPAVVIAKWNVMLAAMDSLADVTPPLYPLQGYLKVKPPCIAKSDADLIATMLLEAKDPVMICGRGAYASKALDEVLEITELLGMPVATSYMGKAIIPEVHDLALGVMGPLGQDIANKKIHDADVLFVVGSALAPENTMDGSPILIDPLRQKIIHIDIDSRNAGWTFPIAIGITSDAKLAVRQIIESIKERNTGIDVQTRITALAELKADPSMKFFYSKFFTNDTEPLAPERVLKEVNDLIREEDMIVLDAGNNRMWFTKLFKSKRAGQIYGLGGAAGMAYGPNAVLTAALLHKTGRAICIAGDGGMMMTLYNFETIKQYKLDPIIVVFNNNCFGNPRDYLSLKGRKLCDYEASDFGRIATAMGLKGVRCNSIDEFHKEFNGALIREGATVIDVVIKNANHLRIRTR